MNNQSDIPKGAMFGKICDSCHQYTTKKMYCVCEDCINPRPRRILPDPDFPTPPGQIQPNPVVPSYGKTSPTFNGSDGNKFFGGC